MGQILTCEFRFLRSTNLHIVEKLQKHDPGEERQPIEIAIEPFVLPNLAGGLDNRTKALSRGHGLGDLLLADGFLGAGWLCVGLLGHVCIPLSGVKEFLELSDGGAELVCATESLDDFGDVTEFGYGRELQRIRDAQFVWTMLSIFCKQSVEKSVGPAHYIVP